MHFLQDNLQKFLTNWFWNHGVIWALHPRDIALLYFFPHIFRLARSTQEYDRLQFDLRPFGYPFFTHTIIKEEIENHTHIRNHITEFEFIWKTELIVKAYHKDWDCTWHDLFVASHFHPGISLLQLMGQDCYNFLSVFWCTPCCTY